MDGNDLVSIHADILASVHALGSPKSKTKGWSALSSESKALTGNELKEIKKLAANHRASLLALRKAAMGKNKSKVAALQTIYIKSYSARVCAVVRVLHKTQRFASGSEIEALAQSVVVGEPLAERVLITFRSKSPKPGWRPIVKHGPRRTIQQLVVRDLLHAMGIDSEFDYTRRHAGGETAYIKLICDHIDNDYGWWSIADVENCFPSLRLGHFQWLPIPYHLVRDVLFLPKCTQIKVIFPKNETIVLSEDTLHEKLPSLSSLIRMAKQGLPQGAACSPLLARSLVGRELREVFGEWEVVGCSHLDDLAIGARSQKEAKAAFNALAKRLQSLPAGPLELHDGAVRPATKGLSALGYRLVPGKGYQPDPTKSRPVHVKPGKLRTDRFKQRLAHRLKRATADADLMQVGDDYWGRWYAAQKAWTKVPDHSGRLSKLISLSYVTDFIDGIPMGENYQKLSKPKKN